MKVYTFREGDSCRVGSSKCFGQVPTMIITKLLHLPLQPPSFGAWFIPFSASVRSKKCQKAFGQGLHSFGQCQNKDDFSYVRAPLTR